jgi:hypothetical protein
MGPMSMTGPASRAPTRRYVRRVIVTMGFYALAVAFISGWLGWEPPREGPLIWLLAMLPPLGVGGCLWSMGRYLDEEPDEFVRMVHARSVIGATGLTLFVATAWGFLGQYAGLWTPPLYLVAPMFWGAFGLVQPFVWRAYR